MSGIGLYIHFLRIFVQTNHRIELSLISNIFTKTMNDSAPISLSAATCFDIIPKTSSRLERIRPLKTIDGPYLYEARNEEKHRDNEYVAWPVGDTCCTGILRIILWCESNDENDDTTDESDGKALPDSELCLRNFSRLLDIDEIHQCRKNQKSTRRIAQKIRRISITEQISLFINPSPSPSLSLIGAVISLHDKRIA